MRPTCEDLVDEGLVAGNCCGACHENIGGGHEMDVTELKDGREVYICYGVWAELEEAGLI